MVWHFMQKQDINKRKSDSEGIKKLQKGKRKVQGVPQSQTEVLPRP